MSNCARKSASNKNDGNGVYVGIPLVRDAALTVTSPPPSAQSKLNSCGGYGLFAFLIGTVLSAIGWVANQGCLLLSFILFGWTLESVWKHVLLSIFGSVCTAIAFWTSFRFIFSDVLEDNEDHCDDDEGDDDVEDEPALCKRDVSDAVQGLGVFGFVAGYFAAHALFTGRLYEHLIGIDAEYMRPDYAVDGATLAMLMLMVLSTKMRNYDRAVKRAKHAERISHDECVESLV